jgi:hypothetical protein
MDATEVGMKARAGFKAALANKPTLPRDGAKIGFSKSREIAADARKALREKV